MAGEQKPPSASASTSSKEAAKEKHAAFEGEDAGFLPNATAMEGDKGVASKSMYDRMLETVEDPEDRMLLLELQKQDAEETGALSVEMILTAARKARRPFLRDHERGGGRKTHRESPRSKTDVTSTSGPSAVTHGRTRGASLSPTGSPTGSPRATQRGTVVARGAPLTPTEKFQRVVTKNKLHVALAALVVLTLVVLGMCVAAIQVSREISVEPETGVLLAHGEDGNPPKTAAAGEAVRLHSLLEYPALSEEQLRAVEDAVFLHRGAYHFFRIAAFVKYNDRHLLLTAPDGSTIRVKDEKVYLRRPYKSEEMVSVEESLSDGVQSLVTSGIFHVFQPTAD